MPVSDREMPAGGAIIRRLTLLENAVAMKPKPQPLGCGCYHNPTTNKWRQVEPMTITKTTRAVVVKGTIYALGGGLDGGKFSPIVEAYDTGFLAVDPKDKLLTHWAELKKTQ